MCNLKKSQISALNKRLGKNGTVMPSKIHRPKILQWEHLNFLTSLLGSSKPGELTLANLRTELLERFDELRSIPLSTIATALNSNEMSYKRVSTYVANRNFTSTKCQRNRVGLQLVAALYLNFTVIFTDETSIHYGMNPDYSWGFRGEKIQQKNTSERTSFSVLTAITDREVLGCVILRGGMTQDDYCGFLCTLIRSIDRLKDSNRIVIFADNLQAHKTALIHTVIANRTTLLFNASYSPMLNPIETFFSKFKRLIKSQVCHTERQLMIAVQSAMERVTRENFNGFMRNTIKYTYKSFADENL